MKKNIVPIAFCFDQQMELAAGVCITSLLENAAPDTFYDIYILHSDSCSFANSRINDLVPNYKNCKITYRSVGDAFSDAFEIRKITIAAYYRLLIPEIIPEYDKIIYTDVDVIFRSDLYSIFETTNMDGYYVAGVSTPYSDITAYVEQTIGMRIDEYICSGTLILNSGEIRKNNIVNEFRRVAKSNWIYQDQDTLNIVCRGNIKIMPPSFGIVGTVSEILADKNQPFYTKEEQFYARHYGIIHYNGPKPWNQLCLNFDIWWEYYRKSIFFDAEYYYKFYNDRLDIFDSLTLWKRIKILLRYFFIRKK
ncbi:MAG: glycosyltransferase family 8 protein [Bacteroidales bacterium]